ncbi:hypothetical protein ACFL24_01845 [Patescibacteria group bacterium]
MTQQIGAMLPKRADQARIQFLGIKDDPRRSMDLITLPFYPDAEFHPLLDEKQFLYHIPTYNGGGEGRVWFGGTDERPFLTELIAKTLKIFKEYGEEEFFEYLKPASIQNLEKVLGIPSKRQGDIFAIPLDKTWDEIKDDLIILTGKEFEEEPVQNYSVLETRHQFSEAMVLDVAGHRLIAEGELTAPDHDPLFLEKPHILDQVDVLRDPKNAD